MKKSNSVIAAVIIIIILVVGGIAIFHKSPKTTSTTTSSTKSSTAAVNNAVLTTKTNASIGQYLVGASGNALYTYGGDTSGKSNCTGSCIAAWPPYVDTGSTTNLPSGVSTIKRTDSGQTQYTYNGMPLYYFSSDSAGQVTGNGVSNFSVAVPAAATSTPATTTPSTQPATNSSNSSNY